METQLMAEKLIRLEEMLREQQAELASLRETLAQKTANRPASMVPATLSAPPQLKTPDPSRRKMLKRMGLVVLAGGAALGIASATYAPAEARISVNPTTNIGAVITRNGKSIINIPSNPNFGLIASPDNSYDASSALAELSGSSNFGIIGLTSVDSNSIGVYGVSFSGKGVNGVSSTSIGVVGTGDSFVGVLGNSANGTGVFGQNNNLNKPAVNAKNNAATNAIALQIEQGGITVVGAGIKPTTSSTAAFVHQSTASNTFNNYTRIDNPLCNNRQNALLFVTYNYNATGSAGNFLNKVLGVFYDTTQNKWNIALEDQSTLSPSLTYYFNVLIINP